MMIIQEIGAASFASQFSGVARGQGGPISGRPPQSHGQTHHSVISRGIPSGCREADKKRKKACTESTFCLYSKQRGADYQWI
jgi:hypothetical protein